MPVPKYTNANLTKTSLPPQKDGNSKIYTDKNPLQSIMPHPPDILDDGTSSGNDHPPDVLDDEVQPESTMRAVGEDEPDDWKSGFINSITSGEALNTGMKGALGFAKGAVLDIPSSLMGMAKGAYNLVTNPKETLSNLPEDIMNMGRHIRDTTSVAGAKPEEFGRMMGQFTGQPIVTAGMLKAAPTVVGGTMEGAGRFMDKFRPVSGSLPTYMARRMARPAERMVGKGMVNVGQKIRAINNKVVGPVDESVPLQEGQELIPDAEMSYRKPMADEGLVEGQDIAPKTKPKVRLNPDGTYTDLGTGEVFDSQGKPMAEPVEPTINKDSPFFKKNRNSNPLNIVKNEKGSIKIGSNKEPFKFSNDLQEEIDYRKDLWKEAVESGESDSPLHANDDLNTQEILKDLESSDFVNPSAKERYIKGWKQQIEDWGINKGIYREISKAERDDRIRNGMGVLARHFVKRGDKYYEFDKHLADTK